MSPAEQNHIVLAYRFELGKVRTFHIRERMIDLLLNVDARLATLVAEGIGVPPPGPDTEGALREANARLLEGWETYGTTGLPGPVRSPGVDGSPALSQATPSPSARGRRVAVLAADGVDAVSLGRVVQGLALEHALAQVVGLRQGPLQTADGGVVVAEHTVLTAPSVMFDAVYVPGGDESVRRPRRQRRRCALRHRGLQALQAGGRRSGRRASTGSRRDRRLAPARFRGAARRDTARAQRNSLRCWCRR